MLKQLASLPWAMATTGRLVPARPETGNQRDGDQAIPSTLFHSGGEGIKPWFVILAIWGVPDSYGEGEQFAAVAESSRADNCDEVKRTNNPKDHFILEPSVEYLGAGDPTASVFFSAATEIQLGLNLVPCAVWRLDMRLGNSMLICEPTS